MIQQNSKPFRVSSAYWSKREFDPANKNDLAEYAYFLEKANWRNGCPFVLEWPHLNIIKMIEDKFTRFYINKEIRSAK